jgi:hypothetical protein
MGCHNTNFELVFAFKVQNIMFSGKYSICYSGHFIMTLGRVYKFRREALFEVLHILFNNFADTRPIFLYFSKNLPK